MNKLFAILEKDVLELEKAAETLQYSYKFIAVDLMDGFDQNALEGFEYLTEIFAKLCDRADTKGFQKH